MITYHLRGTSELIEIMSDKVGDTASISTAQLLVAADHLTDANKSIQAEQRRVAA